MATPTTVGDLINSHPSNKVKDTGYTTATDKRWADKHAAITTFRVHTTYDESHVFTAQFDGPLEPLLADDELRWTMPAYPPNTRDWRLVSETDASNWFHHEISNVVLAAFSEYPALVQVSEATALSDKNIPETVDVMYTVGKPGHKLPVLIVEMKRCLLDIEYWQHGKGGSLQGQRKLSRELRGLVRILLFDKSNAESSHQICISI